MLELLSWVYHSNLVKADSQINYNLSILRGHKPWGLLLNNSTTSRVMLTIIYTKYTRYALMSMSICTAYSTTWLCMQFTIYNDIPLQWYKNIKFVLVRHFYFYWSYIENFQNKHANTLSLLPFSSNLFHALPVGGQCDL